LIFDGGTALQKQKMASIIDAILSLKNDEMD